MILVVIGVLSYLFRIQIIEGFIALLNVMPFDTSGIREALSLPAAPPAQGGF